MPEALTDRELMLNFESIGDNCEFGLVQRRQGAEPLGLLRFSGARMGNLTRALEQRFAGIAEPENVRVHLEHGEYMVTLTKYDFIYHSDVRINCMDMAALHAREVRRTDFLTGKLIGDLETPAKILVFRSNEPLEADQLARFRAALARYGTHTMLWVQEARPEHPPGSVEVADDHLLHGYVRWLAPRKNAHRIDHASWRRICRAAHTLWRSAEAAGTSLSLAARALESRRLVAQAWFGQDGNGAETTGFGWANPGNGFTWALGDGSRVVLAPPPQPALPRLEFDIVSFRAPQARNGPDLSVTVNGELVCQFDGLTPGTASCAVPSRLLLGCDNVEILLEYPGVARPGDAPGGADEREMAIAFRCLTLHAG